jgi:hypothetical protein
MRAKSSKSEPMTAPMTAPAMTPARWAWDDGAPLIGVEEVDDEVGGVEAVVSGGVVIVEEDCKVVEGITDMDVGVAEEKEAMLDSEPVG